MPNSQRVSAAHEPCNTDLQKLVNLSFAKLSINDELQRPAIGRNAIIQCSVTKKTQRICVLQSQQDTIQLTLTETRKKRQDFRSTQYEASSLRSPREGVISVVSVALDLAEQIATALPRPGAFAAPLDRVNPLWRTAQSPSARITHSRAPPKTAAFPKGSGRPGKGRLRVESEPSGRKEESV
jgi:hypothetical protein